MARSSKKYTETSTKQQLFQDDYEDFGYDIANAKRYKNRTQQQRKFKDYTEYDD